MSQSAFRTLPVRVAVAVVAIPAILWLTFQGGYLFAILVAGISTISLFEFYVLAERKGAAPLRRLGLIFGALTTLSFLYDRWHLDAFRVFERAGISPSMPSQLQFLLVVLLLFLLASLLTELFRQKGSPFLNLGSTIAGVAIISLFFGTLIGLREVFVFGFPAHMFAGKGIEGALDAETVDFWGEPPLRPSLHRSGCVTRQHILSGYRSVATSCSNA